MKRLEELLQDVHMPHLYKYLCTFNLCLGVGSLVYGNYAIGTIQLAMGGFFGYCGFEKLKLEGRTQPQIEQSDYSVLGVPRTASTNQIKAAYRALAKKYHPDRNNAPDAPDRFNEATQTYKRLT